MGGLTNHVVLGGGFSVRLVLDVSELILNLLLRLG
jgi:hypothetical protein